VALEVAMVVANSAAVHLVVAGLIAAGTAAREKAVVSARALALTAGLAVVTVFTTDDAERERRRDEK
jgi:hypothetical protein